MEQRVMKMKDMKIREDETGKKYLEGYFAVFNSEYKVLNGWVETIAPGAFARYISSGNDVKVLWNHNHDIVLGSTGNRTAVLNEDSVGLFGSVEINPNDQDALNAHARVDRGDVDGCSFGFDIARQEEWWDDEGVYHTKIIEVDPLFEVSPCTFPAYPSTSISARETASLEKAKERFQQARTKKLEAWKECLKQKLKGDEKNGNQSIVA